MARRKIDNPRGVLNRKAAAEKFSLIRYQPAEDVAFFVERYWIVRWDLRGQEPYFQENIPFPCVNLVFEAGNSRVYGVDTGKFVRRIEGAGQVLGIKFRPGAFYPFVKFPISQLTDKSLRVETLFSVDAALEHSILTLDDDEKMVEIAEGWLRGLLPEQDSNIALINQIVDRIIADHTITKVADIVRHIDISKRTIQRLFSQYVGVSPKWVIQRYRLHEAAEQVASGAVVDWPKLALELGYFDQAHFIKDFKSLVGQSPAEYAKRLNPT
jgi:AraC-like DNA-binding protein